MRFLAILLFSSILNVGFSQNLYEKASERFSVNDFDSARLYINQNLRKNPTAQDYFLSGMIHESEGMDLRAIADYEATIIIDPNNIEAFFQKALIYYHSASLDQAIKDFTYVIDHHSESTTQAIYYGNDPYESKGTFVTTLQSMLGRVHQYRGLAYQKGGYLTEALADFNTSFSYDTLADFYINRSLLYSRMRQDKNAADDLQRALQMEPQNYLAWYNLAILDESTIVPDYLLEDEEFTPMLNLLGANAYEQENFVLSAQYHSKAIAADPNDDLSYISRGKALLRTGAFTEARKDFLQAMRLNTNRTEAFYLIGNSFFYEKKFKEAIGFYEQYLSIDSGYKNVWYNAAMAYLEEGEKDRACVCLKSAERLGMNEAEAHLEKQCKNQ